MFGFIDSDVAEAAGNGDVRTVQGFLRQNPYAVNNRTIFQSNLLHIAARRGQAAIVAELIRHSIDLDALDFGGMRRTALHWSCQQGHVHIVEQLVASGADTKVWCSQELLEQHQAQGKTWSKLVQGRECGKMIDVTSPIDESPAAMCKSHAVRLALNRPQWSTAIHHMWPERFKDAVRMLLLASAAQRSSVPEGQDQPASWLLDWDTTLHIVGMVAYPISQWIIHPDV